MDAFALDWAGYYVYAFPPFHIISKVVQKFKREKPKMVLVVPDWPTQPWYSQRVRLMTCNTLILGKTCRPTGHSRQGQLYLNPMLMKMH